MRLYELLSDHRRENLRNRRLDNNNKDDDENATWNGNSTQQM